MKAAVGRTVKEQRGGPERKVHAWTEDRVQSLEPKESQKDGENVGRWRVGWSEEFSLDS